MEKEVTAEDVMAFLKGVQKTEHGKDVFILTVSEIGFEEIHQAIKEDFEDENTTPIEPWGTLRIVHDRDAKQKFDLKREIHIKL
jgi:hypothetical protein